MGVVTRRNSERPRTSKTQRVPPDVKKPSSGDLPVLLAIRGPRGTIRFARHEPTFWPSPGFFPSKHIGLMHKF
jgi:hypothetical protein